MFDYAKPKQKSAPKSIIQNEKTKQSTTDGVVQMAKWQWNDATKIWSCITKDAVKSAPKHTGTFHGEIFDDTPNLIVKEEGFQTKEKELPMVSNKTIIPILNFSAINQSVPVTEEDKETLKKSPTAPKKPIVSMLNVNLINQSIPVTEKDKETLKGWIMKMKDNILGGNYNMVIDKLNMSCELSEEGYPIKALKNIEFCNQSKDNMFFKKPIKVKIYIPPKIDSFDSEIRKNAHTTDLLRALEEYIHAYQFFSKSFISGETEKFLGTTGYNDTYDEADILAFYQEVGFDVEKLGYIEPYSERKEYMEWKKKNLL